MPAVRQNSAKWARNSASASASYKEGTANPRRPWKESTLAGEGNFEFGITQAISDKRFGKGVEKAGDAAYNAGVREKGATRFTQAVVLPSSQSNYQRGFAPFAAAIEAVTLPPKQPKGQNLDRVRAIQDALIAEKAKA